MKQNVPTRTLLTALALTTLLAGCGGGGAKSADAAPEPPVPMMAESPRGLALNSVVEPTKPDTSPEHLTQIYISTAQKIKTTMLECPEKIWPGYSWKEMNVLMLLKNGPSLVWKGETGAIEPIRAEEIPATAYDGLYSFFPWKNENAVSVSLQSPGADGYADEENLLGLIVHEGFHYLGQRDWTLRHAARGTNFPMQAAPRIYRRLLNDRLADYVVSEGKNPEALGKAAFWFQKWSKEFPDEVQAAADGYEGTARYVQALAPAVAQLGCAVSDEALLSHIKQQLLTQGAFSLGPYILELDSESYSIGALSALTLRLIEKNQQWFEAMKTGTTPTEFLLKDVPPIEDTPGEALPKDYESETAKYNQVVAEWLGDDLTKLFLPETVRIYIPASATHGSYTPRGFFLPKGQPGTTVIPLADEYPLSSDGWALTAKTGANLFKVPQAPCENTIQTSGAFILIAAPTDAHVGPADQLEIHTRELDGKVVGDWKTDPNGLKWFCAK
jgi:hypothetical protein